MPTTTTADRIRDRENSPTRPAAGASSAYRWVLLSSPLVSLLTVLLAAVATVVIAHIGISDGRSRWELGLAGLVIAAIWALISVQRENRVRRIWHSEFTDIDDGMGAWEDRTEDFKWAVSLLRGLPGLSDADSQRFLHALITRGLGMPLERYPDDIVERFAALALAAEARDLERSREAIAARAPLSRAGVTAPRTIYKRLGRTRPSTALGMAQAFDVTGSLADDLLPLNPEESAARDWHDLGTDLSASVSHIRRAYRLRTPKRASRE